MTLPELLCQALQHGAGLDADEAKAITAEIIAWGASNGHAGVEHYWPCKVRDMDKAERDAAIRREFNGKNVKDLCIKYGVSHTTVYMAVRKN